MILQRATHLGMCFGVRDALALAHAHADQGPLTILGDLVHNEAVLAGLRARGIRFESEPDQAATTTVMITAHGASQAFLQTVRNRGHAVIEATCPLVNHAHRAVHELVAAGYHPVIVGQRNHVEVRGLTGDLEQFDVILSAEDVAALPPRPRFGVAAQTTQPVERVRHLVGLLRERFPESEVVFRDTVCQPTKQRQAAAIQLAQRSDVVIVVGGAHSNNTRELVATCSRFCPRVHHVQSAADLQPGWFTGAQRVGLTAGTSTPDGVIDAVATAIEQLHSQQEAA